MKFRLFPFSLKEIEKIWLHSIWPNSITSWNIMVQDVEIDEDVEHKINAG